MKCAYCGKHIIQEYYCFESNACYCSEECRVHGVEDYYAEIEELNGED